MTAVAARASAGGVSERNLAYLDEHLQRYIDSGRLAGTLSVVYRRGETVHWRAQGQADRERGVPIRDDTIFRIYSMSKPITSVALMQLFERGLVQLDDPVHRYIPSWEKLRVYLSGVHPNFLTTPCERPMTVRDLLSHQSGLTYGFAARTNVDAAYRRLGIYEQCRDLQEMVDKLAEVPLEFSPGSFWNYSVSVDVQGYLVQVISGQSFDAYLQEHIFAPLGMRDTAFWVRPDQAPRFAANYTAAPEGGIRVFDDPQDSAYLKEATLFSGGGGLVSTASDYLQFCRMLLGRGTLEESRIIGRKTLQLMTRNALPGNRSIYDCARAGLYEAINAGSGFALGFAVALDTADGQISGTPGEFNWSGAAATHFWIDPVEDLAVVFMTQYMAMSPEARYNLHREIRSIVYGALD